MRNLLHILRITVVGGAFFLAPFVLLIFLFGKAIQMLRVVTVPLPEWLPYESLIGFETPRLLAVFILVLICFFTGLFSKSSLAKKLVT
jgi:hypothetical protein